MCRHCSTNFNTSKSSCQNLSPLTQKKFFKPKPTTHKQTTSCSELVRHRHHHPQQRFACTSGRRQAGRQAASGKDYPIERTSSRNHDRKLSIVIHKLQH
jgi:hypothetical protein